LGIGGRFMGTVVFYGEMSPSSGISEQ
jgi:hypothetical protein